MKNDSLFRLIKALDKGQLRYCRQALAMAQGDMTESRLAVFDQLYSMTEYDADALKNAVENLPIARNLAVEKVRLFGQLLGHLKTLNQIRLPANDPYIKLEEARVLLELSLYDEAREAVLKGLHAAVAMEDLFAEVPLRETLRLIYKNMNSQELTNVVTENEYLAETASMKLATLIRYTHINDRAYDYLRRYRVTDDEAKKRGMEDLIKLPELTDIKRANSLPAQLRFYYVWNCYHSSRNELDLAVEMAQKILHLQESNPVRLKRYGHYYFSSLSNLVGKLILHKRFDEVPPLLEKMKSVNVIGRRAEIEKFINVELYHQLYFMNLGKLDEATAREEGIVAGLRRFGSRVNNSRKLTLMYNLGITHLINDDPRSAYRWFNRIKDLGELPERKDLQGVSRLLRLLLLSDPTHNTNVGHFLRSGKRFFSKEQSSYQMEDTVYDWLFEHHRITGIVERKESLQQFSSLLEPHVEKGLLGAEEMLIWTEAQVRGVLCLQVYKERTGLN